RTSSPSSHCGPPAPTAAGCWPCSSTSARSPAASSGGRRVAPDRREAGHLLEIGKGPVAADVAPGGVVGRGKVPRGRCSGAERVVDGNPPPLALADLAVQGREVPARSDLP